MPAGSPSSKNIFIERGLIYSFHCLRIFAKAVVSLLHAIPRLQHQPAGAVFAELASFAVLEDAKGFGGVVVAADVGWVEDVAQLVTG